MSSVVSQDRKRVTSTTSGNFAARTSRSVNHSAMSTVDKASRAPKSRQRQTKSTPLRPRTTVKRCALVKAQQLDGASVQNPGPKTVCSRAPNTNNPCKPRDVVLAQKLLEVCQSMSLDVDAIGDMVWQRPPDTHPSSECSVIRRRVRRDRDPTLSTSA